MQHPDEGTIHAWLDDALPPAEAASVAAHVDACEQCAAAVAEARGLIAGASRIVSSLDVVRGGVIPDTVERWNGGMVERGRRSGANRRSVWGTLHLTPSRAGLVAAVLIGIVLVEGRGERGGGRGNNPVFRSQMPVGRRTDSVLAASAPVAAAVSRAPSAKAPATAGAAASTRAEKPAATKRVAPSEGPAEAKTEKPVATRESGLPAMQLQEIVTTGVTATNGKIAPSASPVSSAAAAPVRRALDSGARAPARANAATAGFARMRATDLATGGNFEGCYDVQQAPATSLRPLPDRFALEHTTTPTGATENVVRPIEPDGRRAEPLPNGEWRQVSQVAANVTWVSNGQTRLLTLRAGADGVMGRADSVVVLKTECR